MKKFRFAIIVICACVIGISVALPSIKRQGLAVKCSNQMNAVLLATARLWPEDHEGRLPTDFQSVSEELSNPQILICPADHVHHPATNFKTFTMSNNCSYEIVAPGILQSNTNTIFLRCKIHGFVGYPDGRLLDSTGKVLKPKRFW